MTILLGSPPIWGTAARYASISSSRSWTVIFFLVKRAGPFLVFFLFVGTAFGLVTTSAGAAGVFLACCLGFLGLQSEGEYAVKLNGTRAYAPARKRALTGRGLSPVRCSSFPTETSAVMTEKM